MVLLNRPARSKLLPIMLALGLLTPGVACSSKPAETDTAEVTPNPAPKLEATPNPPPTPEGGVTATPAPTPSEPKP